MRPVFRAAIKFLPFGAIFPLALLIFITFPKAYDELRALEWVGSPSPQLATIVWTYKRNNSCFVKLMVDEHTFNDEMACDATWQAVRLGELRVVHPVRNLYFDIDEILGHLAIEVFLVILFSLWIVFFLCAPRLIRKVLCADQGPISGSVNINFEKGI